MLATAVAAPARTPLAAVATVLIFDAGFTAGLLRRCRVAFERAAVFRAAVFFRGAVFLRPMRAVFFAFFTGVRFFVVRFAAVFFLTVFLAMS